MKIYLNGHFVDKEDAKISVFDHGLSMEMGCLKAFVFTMIYYKLNEH